jgi:peptidoglycan-associated lipoprotein
LAQQEFEMKRYLAVGAVAVMLAGCGSSVKLDDVAVEDKSGTPVSAQSGADQGAGAAGAGTGDSVAKSNVPSVDLTKQGSNNDALLAGQRIVYFDYDSFVIKSEFQAVIENHARALRADRNRRVVIEGHTDDRGGREYNLALGQKRAEAVRRALGLLGVSDNQMEAVSFGKEKPAVQGSDESAMAQNRRAELRYR